MKYELQIPCPNCGEKKKGYLNINNGKVNCVNCGDVIVEGINHHMKKVDVIKAFDNALNKVLSSDLLKRELAESFLAETGLFEYARDLFENDDGSDGVQIAELISNMNCEDV